MPRKKRQRHEDNVGVDPRQTQMPMYVMPPMMHPQMMPQMPMPAIKSDQHERTKRNTLTSDSDESDSSSYDSTKRLAKKKAAKADAKALTSSATHICELPTNRLQKFVTACHAEYDSIITSEFDRPELAKLVFLFSKIKPNMPISKFQAKDYKQATIKVVEHMRRRRRGMGGAEFEAMVKLLDSGGLNPQNIASVSKRYGFEDEWMDLAKFKKKGKLAHDRQMQGQQTLNITHNNLLCNVSGNSPRMDHMVLWRFVRTIVLCTATLSRSGGELGVCCLTGAMCGI